MNTAHDTQPPGGPPPPGSRPPLGGLTRSTDDTVVSGLCGGLGRQFGIDPLVFRIAFVVMSLAGGTGILLYLVGWALVPDDQGQTFGARWLPGKDRGHKLLAAALAGVGLILLLDQITDGRGDDIPLGLVLVGVGAAVLWSRRNGSTPWRPSPPAPPSPPTDPGQPAWVPAPAPAPVAGDVPGTAEPAPTDPTVSEAIADPTTPLPAGSSSALGMPPPPPPPPPPLVPPLPPVYAARASAPPKPPKAAKPRSALVAVTFCLLAILAGVVALAGGDLVVGLGLGLLLVAGAMIVGAWRGRARGLIPLAVVMSMALFLATLLDVPFRGGAGERLYVPASVAELHSPYRLVAGELRLDLRHVGLTGQTVPVVASVATGVLIVTVPAATAVEVNAHAGAGDLLLLGRTWEGVDLTERVVAAGREGGGRLVLDLTVGLGEVEVRRAAA